MVVFMAFPTHTNRRNHETGSAYISWTPFGAGFWLISLLIFELSFLAPYQSLLAPCPSLQSGSGCPFYFTASFYEFIQQKVPTDNICTVYLRPSCRGGGITAL